MKFQEVLHLNLLALVFVFFGCATAPLPPVYVTRNTAPDSDKAALAKVYCFRTNNTLPSAQAGMVVGFDNMRLEKPLENGAFVELEVPAGKHEFFIWGGPGKLDTLTLETSPQNTYYVYFDLGPWWGSFFGGGVKASISSASKKDFDQAAIR